MQISAGQITGSKVFDTEGKPIGKVLRAIIDVETGHILAFEMKMKGARYISPQDVTSWKGTYLILGQEYEIHEAKDLVRLHDLIKSRKQGIIGKKVVTESGQKLGMATDYQMNSKYFSLSNISVEKSFFGLFRYDGKLISHKSIVRITSKKIIVLDAWEKIRASQNSPEKLGLRNAATLDRALSVDEDHTS